MAGIQIPPLLFSGNLQGKLSALSTRLYVERGIYHNGRSFEVLREEVVEAHGGLAVHGGGSIVGAHLPHGFLPVARQQATPRFAAPDRIAQPPARGGRGNTGLSASRPAGTAQRRRRPPWRGRGWWYARGQRRGARRPPRTRGRPTRRRGRRAGEPWFRG